MPFHLWETLPTSVSSDFAPIYSVEGQKARHTDGRTFPSKLCACSCQQSFLPLPSTTEFPPFCRRRADRWCKVTCSILVSREAAESGTTQVPVFVPFPLPLSSFPDSRTKFSDFTELALYMANQRA